MTGLAQRFDAGYTRYADDLVLSGGPELAAAARRVTRLVHDIAADEGFRLHDAKTRLTTAAQRQMVTGLVVNAHPNIRRDEYDRLKAILHDAARHGPAAANRDGRLQFRAHLEGRISWVRATNPARGDELDRAFAAIAWP